MSCTRPSPKAVETTTEPQDGTGEDWADYLCIKPDNTLRVVLKNINTINRRCKGDKNDNIIEFIKKHDVDVVGLMELNQCWQKIPRKDCLQQ